jgi:aryl-alcohol dehydrogenase-like predicted oxidoreductase
VHELNPFGLHPVGLGTFAFAGRLSPVTEANAIAVVDAFVADGGTYLETAPSYAGPNIDLRRVLGRYPRDTFVLATKCVIDPAAAAGGGRAAALTQFAAETERLGTDYLDLVQIRILGHPDEDVAGALRGLAELRREGRIRWIGLSRLRSPVVLSALAQETQVDLLQNRLSLVYRSEHLRELVEECRQRAIGLNPCQVLERGQLCETTVASSDRGACDIRNTKAEYNGSRHGRIRDWVESQLVPLAHDSGMSTEQLSIGWALSQPGVRLCVVGATRPSQIHSAMTAPHTLPADVRSRVEALLRPDLMRSA